MDWVGVGSAARRHWVFGVALAGAIVVRVLVMLAFRPIMWFGGDSASYLATGLHLIPDPSRVSGFGVMLWLLGPLARGGADRARQGAGHRGAQLPAGPPVRAAGLGRDARRGAGVLRRVRASA